MSKNPVRSATFGAAAFTRAMARLGPFEPAPRIAVAVSGGADSMALALAAGNWARRMGGEAVGLTVDHRLRPEAAKEARQVRAWLGGHGIAHRTLHWAEGPEGGASNLQARARSARYRLMREWCASRGILHLLTAHHLDDQAETLLLRIGRGTGLNGLAAIPAILEYPEVRVLRPLLDIPADALRAYLRRAGQDWVEDPSNGDPRFARVRLRALMPALAAEGIDAAGIAGTARRAGRDRRMMEDILAHALARTVFPHPAGFVRLNRAALLNAPPELGLRVLGRAIAAVSGPGFGPRFARLERLFGELAAAPRARTLGGCRIVPGPNGNLLVVRETRALAVPLQVDMPGTYDWDRFRLRIGGKKPQCKGGGLRIGALGQDGWAEIRRGDPGLARSAAARAIPAQARPVLPAIYDSGGLREVPHLGYRRPQSDTASLKLLQIRPFPGEPMAGPGFGLA